MRYGKGLRGTRQFWIARRGELTDMIKQIGHKSLIFYNFSAADFHWPNLHRLMLDDEDTQSKEKWDLEDWWFRYEWQHRENIHMHGIGKKRNALTIEWKDLKNNEEEMKNVIDYIDSIVTTINPVIHAPIPEKHPPKR
ncbi:hypothetical protein RhiirA5_424660 [Rhizophagus irregularis]|uniref:Helitron helicase-like domain-containing protein n=1 Tax=Rhizophagus irregularis TaxID=588596 RepID=A0A2N0QXA3_9GLOM|nr:hypothetical protein RhiirA5_424660 [Rhizophagus irregularis]PKC55698.1 hypothetical protein RhiirA1_475167 [Rhizophagus irregularis]